jgi:hypothetical protein
MRNLPAVRRGLAGWTGFLLVAAIVVSIGTPLIGLTAFHASDVLQVHAPWAHDAPHDFRSQNGFVTDTVDAVGPSRLEFRQRVLNDGEFPLWNPWFAGGSPLGAIPNASTLLPFTWLWLLLPAWFAPGMVKLLEMAVAAGFTALFARRLGLGWAAGLLAGLVYVNSGSQVVWTNWPQAQLGALIPALFWAVERALPGGGSPARDAPRSVVALWPVAVVSAFMWLAGFPAVALWAHVAAGVYVLVRLAGVRRGQRPASPPRPRRARRTRPIPSLLGRLVGVPALMVLGLGLAALQLVPFARLLPRMDLAHRVEKDVGSLPWETVITLAIPDAYGNPAAGGFYGPIHYVEVQSFVGVVALLLAVVALVAWRRTAPRAEVSGFLWGGVAVTGMLIFVGGPLLDLHDAIPVVGGNQVGRMRVLLGLFLAVLAGVGFQAIADGAVRRSAALAAGWSVLAVGVAILLVPAFDAAAEAGMSEELTGRVGFAVFLGVLGVIVLGAAVLTMRRAPWATPFLLAIVPVVVAVESVAFAHTFWPTIDRDHFYPETEAHTYIRDELGTDRVAPSHFALFPGTNAVYGIRSVTAHTLTPPPYADLLLEVDPNVFDRSRTFPVLTPGEEVATSPVLDRMGATLYVAPPHVAVIGPVTGLNEADEVAEFGGSDTLTAPIPAGAFRAARLTVEDPRETGAAVWLAVEVLDADGDVIADGRRRVDTRYTPDGAFDVPVVPAEDGWPEGDVGGWSLEVSVETTRGLLRLATTAEGEPALSLVGAADEGLELVWGEGVVVYERGQALPRIRWASSAEVVEDAEERVARLAAGDVADEVVLLAEEPAEGAMGAPAAPGTPAAPDGGETADIEIIEDAGDRIALRVTAEEGGWLVVADSLQDGWEATIDGTAAELVSADHAFGAVTVAGGAHEVVLTYRPDGWGVGRLISLVSLVVLAVTVVAARRGRTA